MWLEHHASVMRSHAVQPGQAIDHVLSGLLVQHPVTIADTAALRDAILALVPGVSVEVYCRGPELVLRAAEATRVVPIQEYK